MLPKNEKSNTFTFREPVTVLKNSQQSEVLFINMELLKDKIVPIDLKYSARNIWATYFLALKIISLVTCPGHRFKNTPLYCDTFVMFPILPSVVIVSNT